MVNIDAVGVHHPPDPRARIPGRGAWLHPDLDCLDLAVRRRALPRAFKLTVPLDDGAVDVDEVECTRSGAM